MQVAMQHDTATLDRSLAVLYKNKLAMQPSIHIPGIDPRENVHVTPHRCLYTRVQSKFICISQRLEWPKCSSTDEWLDRPWCVHTAEYCSAMKGSRLWLYTSWRNLRGIMLTENMIPLTNTFEVIKL